MSFSSKAFFVVLLFLISFASAIVINSGGALILAGSYTLAGNLNLLLPITIQATPITIDCGGLTLDGLNLLGLNAINILPSYDNVTIQNCIFKNFNVDILSMGSNYHRFTNITFGTPYGLVLNNTNNTITSNSVFQNITSIGIWVLNNSNNNTIYNFTLNATNQGIGVVITNNSNNNNITQGQINSTNVIVIANTSNNNSITNLTINGTTTNFKIDNSSGYNQIFWNILMGNGSSISNNNITNQFNTTSNGMAQGNYYMDACKLNMTDSNGKGYANGGNQYAYNSTNTNNYSGVGSDFGPVVCPLVNYYPDSLSFVTTSSTTGINFIIDALFNTTCTYWLNGVGQNTSITCSNFTIGNYRNDTTNNLTIKINDTYGRTRNYTTTFSYSNYTVTNAISIINPSNNNSIPTGKTIFLNYTLTNYTGATCSFILNNFNMSSYPSCANQTLPNAQGFYTISVQAFYSTTNQTIIASTTYAVVDASDNMIGIIIAYLTIVLALGLISFLFKDSDLVAFQWGPVFLIPFILYVMAWNVAQDANLVGDMNSYNLWLTLNTVFFWLFWLNTAFLIYLLFQRITMHFTKKNKTSNQLSNTRE